ncbi:MAG: LytTR family DNA-binding domain-containing protein [Bacteroidota bacterium]
MNIVADIFNLKQLVNVKGRRLMVILFALLTCLVFMGLMQDYFESRLLEYSFYWSESLLFKIVWVPFIFAAVILTRLPKDFFRQKYFIISMPILLTLCHLLLFAGLIYCLSALMLDHVYAFAPIFRKAAAEDSYKYLIVYTVMVTVLNRYSKIGSISVLSPPAKTTNYQDVLTITTGKKTITVSCGDIYWIGTDEPYVAIYQLGRHHLASTSLKALEERLDPTVFIRIHRSTIINIKQVASYHTRLNGDYDVSLKDGSLLRLSRKYSKDFKKLINGYSA